MSADHPHHPSPPAVLGLLDGRPLSRAALDHRLAALRNGPRAPARPRPGSAKARQLTRWLAQVLLTEALCEAEAEARGLRVDAAPPVRLDQREAVELGSITAAAYEGSAAVRAVFEAVTADVTVPADQAAPGLPGPPVPREIWHVSTPAGDFEAAPETLPRELAAALRTTPPGEQVVVGPWTAALTGRHIPEPEAPTADPLPRARRAAFVRWLDRARAERLTLVPGLEHPGDPNQPDNHHQH